MKSDAEVYELLETRRQGGKLPFKWLREILGRNSNTDPKTFTVKHGDDKDDIEEALLRFIYLYKKKYKGNPWEFMEKASLQDFR